MSARHIMSAIPAPIRRFLKWAIIAFGWVAFLLAARAAGLSAQWGRVDFEVYFQAARQFAAGISPYQGTTGLFYLYPPLLAQILAPFAALDPIAAWQAWFAVNAAALIVTLALFSRWGPASNQALLWLSPLLFEPILDSLYIGQITILLLLLLTAAYVARSHDQRLLTGALLASAAWLKVWPAFMLLYFLWRRDWRVVWGGVTAGVLLALAQIAASGVGPFLDSFGVVFSLAEAGQATRASTSISILGFASQWFQQNLRVTAVVVSPLLYTLTRLGLSLGVVAILGRMTFSRASLTDSFDQRRFRLEYSLTLLTALLLSPTLWASGMPPMLLCFWLIWSLARRQIRLILALAFILISVHGWFMIGYEGEPALSAPVLSFGFGAVAVLWGVHLFASRSLATSAAADRASVRP
ncbi:MAG: DUF2029 domain-containing protein [Anaerolineae bacterium]|nr:DUF2029 domain-containing protein [Anaerolineae bacterium]